MDIVKKHYEDEVRKIKMEFSLKKKRSRSVYKVKYDNGSYTNKKYVKKVEKFKVVEKLKNLSKVLHQYETYSRVKCKS